MESVLIEGQVEPEAVNLVMLGLDEAGKTTILYKFLERVVQIVPTIGFNVETVQHKNKNFTIWDVGGQYKIRPLWRHYSCIPLKGVIYVVDSSDRERIEEARHELMNILEDYEVKDAVLIIFANKQDMPNVMSPAEISDKLGLHNMKNPKWHVQKTSATTGDGIFEGLDWLSQGLKNVPAE